MTEVNNLWINTDKTQFGSLVKTPTLKKKQWLQNIIGFLYAAIQIYFISTVHISVICQQCKMLLF